MRDQEATITAVTATSITVTSSHIDTQKVRQSTARTNNGYNNGNNNNNNNGNNRKNDSAAIAAATSTKSVTYQINELTDIEVNGETAQASALRPGMAVSISADPPLSLSAPDPTDGGTARNISAHDAPGNAGGGATATTAQ